MRRFMLPWLAVLSLAIAGCGGGGHHTSSTHSTTTTTAPTTTVAPPASSTTTTSTTAPSLSVACPAGQAYMGCSLKSTASPLPRLTLPAISAPNGTLFPDVSVWQGANVNWPAIKAWQLAHGWTPSGIFKIGEFSIDPDAAINNTRMRAAGMWRAGYWFVRPSTTAAQIIAEARALGLKVIVLDAEVSGIRGKVAQLAPALRAAGFIVVEYTSPGTNPDALNPGVDVWAAAYGPSLPCVFTCKVEQAIGIQSIRAWQFTDGLFGAVTTIPGLGNGDVSVDYGITKLGTPAHVTKAGGIANATIHFTLSKGHWTVTPTSGTVHLSHTGQQASVELQFNTKTGRWRARPLPANARPLGR